MKMNPTKTKKKPTDIALRIPSLCLRGNRSEANQITSLNCSSYSIKHI
jgi:hypothetical protein